MSAFATSEITVVRATIRGGNINARLLRIVASIFNSPSIISSAPPLESQFAKSNKRVVRPDMMTGKADKTALIMPLRPSVIAGIICGVIDVRVVMALTTRENIIDTKSGSIGPTP